MTWRRRFSAPGAQTATATLLIQMSLQEAGFFALTCAALPHTMWRIIQPVRRAGTFADSLTVPTAGQPLAVSGTLAVNAGAPVLQV